MSEPIIGAASVSVSLTFDIGTLAGADFGSLFNSFEFRAMMNGGYIIKVELFDPTFILLSRLTEEGYFRNIRSKPIMMKFQIIWGSDGTFPESATEPQIAIISSLRADGDAAYKGNLEFIAVDPPSWYLNTGDASGGVYTGRADQVISQVVQQYAPNINLEIGRTTDSEYNKWWMMRQDPKTFISSLTDWSASITQKKTQWIINSDGNDLVIKEQAEIPSNSRGYYRYSDSPDRSTILKWEFLADNALSIVEAKLITQGLSAISGQYFDRITDSKEIKLFVDDDNTPNKQIARIKADQGFTKPPDARPPQVGWSSIAAIPEIYSAGELGLQYDDYIDGRARAMWLNLTNALMRVKFTVIGHGEWSSGIGLGTDTVFIKWAKAKSENDDQYWWMTGNWLVYGFEHRLRKGSWVTDLYCARYDVDSNSKKIGG